MCARAWSFVRQPGAQGLSRDARRPCGDVAHRSAQLVRRSTPRLRMTTAATNAPTAHATAGRLVSIATIAAITAQKMHPTKIAMAGPPCGITANAATVVDISAIVARLPADHLAGGCQSRRGWGARLAGRADPQPRPHFVEEVDHVGSVRVDLRIMQGDNAHRPSAGRLRRAAERCRSRTVGGRRWAGRSSTSRPRNDRIAFGAVPAG